MTPFINPQLIEAGYVFLGIFMLLALASLCGSLLSSRMPNHPLLREFNARINSWWAMSIILLLAFRFGHIGATLLFTAVSFAALREFMTLVYRRRSDHNAIAACFYVLLPLQYYFVLTDWYGMFAALIPVYAFLILPVIAGWSGDSGSVFERTAKIQWGAMITIFCISHVPAVMNLEIKGFEDRNILLLIFMMLTVQAGDVLQYLWGRLPVGKRTLSTSLAPDKTLLGVAGGMLSASALAGCLYWLTPFTPLQAVLIGMVVAMMGFFGQLVMSAIKRSYGETSWCRTDGRGAMLDRVGSLCFAAPVFFHIVRYYWV